MCQRGAVPLCELRQARGRQFRGEPSGSGSDPRAEQPGSGSEHRRAVAHEQQVAVELVDQPAREATGATQRRFATLSVLRRTARSVAGIDARKSARGRRGIQ